jgi:two-component system response regulator
MKLKPLVLLVEDSPDDELFTLKAFRNGKNNATVVVAHDGEEAIAMLTGAHSVKATEPDLILLDLKMPKLSGLEVLRIIRSYDRLKKVPVIILSSSDEDRDVNDCYALGANSYIRKPVDFEAYQEAIRHIDQYWLGMNAPL